MFVGADLAVAPDYAGIAPMAQRTDREIITMDARGVGHSTPNLACPEVEKLSASSLGVPTGDATMRSRFLNAVAACYHRLRREGIDLSSYDLHQNAADTEELRKALRIRQWWLTATGTDSRVIVQALREYPQHVREAVLDGADFPQADPFSEAIRGTRHAIGQMDTTCSADPSCNRRFPHFAQAVAKVAARLTSKPVMVTVPAASGQPIRISFDGALFLRGLRDLLAAIPRDDAGLQIPALIHQVLGSATNSRCSRSPSGWQPIRPTVMGTSRNATTFIHSPRAPTTPSSAATSSHSPTGAFSPSSPATTPPTSRRSLTTPTSTYARAGRCAPRTRPSRVPCRPTSRH